MARTTAQIQAIIDGLDGLLASGTNSITIDGVTTNYRSQSDIIASKKYWENQLRVRNGESPISIYRNLPLSNGGNL